MKAQDIMTSEPIFITPDESTVAAARIMRDAKIGMVPVVEDPQSMRLVGVITDRDITVRCYAAGHGQECRVRDHMSGRPLQTAHPGDSIDRIATEMEDAQVRRIPIVDERDRLVGIIAQADIATKVGPSQPDLVETVLELISKPALVV
jgi:CBS domain-containing protein